jgi:hypothetical protein
MQQMVRMALERIVLRQRLADQFQRGIDLGAHQFSQLANGELPRVADVDGPGVRSIHQTDDALD